MLLAVILAVFGWFPGAPLNTLTNGEPICRPGSDFWDPVSGRCLPCTKCAPEFTLRPCAVHQDAVCGPLSALELDWSWLAARKNQETQAEVAAATSKMIWRFPDVADGVPGSLTPVPRSVDDEVPVDEEESEDESGGSLPKREEAAVRI